MKFGTERAWHARLLYRKRLAIGLSVIAVILGIDALQLGVTWSGHRDVAKQAEVINWLGHQQGLSSEVATAAEELLVVRLGGQVRDTSELYAEERLRASVTELESVLAHMPRPVEELLAGLPVTTDSMQDRVVPDLLHSMVGDGLALAAGVSTLGEDADAANRIARASTAVATGLAEISDSVTQDVTNNARTARTNAILVWGGVSTLLLAGFAFLNVPLWRRVRDTTLALSDSDSRFHSLLEDAPDATLGIDQSGRVVVVNHRTETMFGFSREELFGRPVEMLIPKRFRNVHESHRQGFVNSPRQRLMGSEVYALHKEGYEFPIEVTLSPISTAEGPVFLAAIRDISTRKALEREIDRHLGELRASNAELEQFAYAASHDMQEPLRTISNFAQLLERRYKGQLDDHADEFIFYISDAAARMSALVRDLLEFSRVGRSAIEKESVDLNVLMRDVAASLGSTIDEREVDLTIGPLPVVLAAPSEMTRLFQNLIGNAAKYCEGKPEITVSAEEEQGSFLIKVNDNGIGVEPEYREQIFEIFKRLHGRTEYSGTGVGLAIAKKIVLRHGGRIWVEGNERGGSTFCIALPQDTRNAVGPSDQTEEETLDDGNIEKAS